MADDQPPSNEIGEGEGEAGEGADADTGADYDEAQTAATEPIGDPTPAPAPAPAPAPGPEVVDDTGDGAGDGAEEPVEDYVVNMVVNEDGATIPPDILNAAATDIHGNLITGRTSLVDSINGYTTAIYDQVNGNGTGITGGKRWWDNQTKIGSLSPQGWSTKKILFAALIALCILGIILAIVFLVLKKLKKNKKPVASTSTGATAQAAVNKNVSPNPKYHQVPSV